MTYKETVEAVNNNCKVKLPEWQGYWFKDTDGILKAVTKGGTVVVAPDMLLHKDREDWEYTDGCRDIGGAMSAVKRGFRVKRRGWDSEINVWVRFGNNERKPTISDHLYVASMHGYLHPYTPTPDDALVEDWVII